MGGPLPVANQDGSGPQTRPVWHGDVDRLAVEGLVRDAVEETGGCLVEVAEGCGLDPIGQHPQEQRLREVRRGRPPGQAAPARAQALKIETAQVRDLALDGSGPAVAGHLQAAFRERVTRAEAIR
jgi:hypothetical protein